MTPTLVCTTTMTSEAEPTSSILKLPLTPVECYLIVLIDLEEGNAGKTRDKGWVLSVLENVTYNLLLF